MSFASIELVEQARTRCGATMASPCPPRGAGPSEQLRACINMHRRRAQRSARFCRIPRVRWSSSSRCDSPAGTGAMNQRRPAACMRARENGLGCRPGCCPGVNQASSLSSPSPWCRGTCDDPGLVDGDDVRGAVAAGAADLVAGPAGQVRQADRPNAGADLFTGLPDRCRGGWRPPPRRRRGYPGRRRGRHGGSAAPGLPRGRAGPAPGGTGSSSCPATARSVALCTRRNTHWRYPGLAGDRRRAFSIVLVGNQIADSARPAMVHCVATKRHRTA